VVFLGDSLTAGYGLTEEEAFPALLGGLLRGRGVPVRIVNAGVSGDTSAGGLRRLPWLLTQHPDVLVVALGANDGLRGLPVAHTEENLRAIVARAQHAGARVLLLGLRLPPNLGADYVRAFEAVFPRVAREARVPLVPFFLEGVGGVAALNQEDGIHPTAEGQRRIAATVLPYLQPVLEVR
jgi:acyl-CoA thioesterase-1